MILPGLLDLETPVITMYLPHTRGDEPDVAREVPISGNHLPHTRGDEPLPSNVTAQFIGICPTRVGMNRVFPFLKVSTLCICPTRVGMNRIRQGPTWWVSASAPHAWG